MRSRPLLALTAVLVTVAGCSDLPEPEIVRPPEAVVTEPAYDPELEPAAAVMAVVPAAATVLEVTDFDQVRFSLGYGDLTSESEP
ncbi:MAG: hypothetical protein JWN84_2505, partial [Nocardioides sp.]|nr:hypothetical protein [Nocardioides sp.]